MGECFEVNSKAGSKPSEASQRNLGDGTIEMTNSTIACEEAFKFDATADVNLEEWFKAADRNNVVAASMADVVNGILP